MRKYFMLMALALVGLTLGGCASTPSGTIQQGAVPQTGAVSWEQRLLQMKSADAHATLPIHLEPQPPVTLGADLRIRVASRNPGYMTLFEIGSSGKTWRIGHNRRIDAGQWVQLPPPRADYRLSANEPPGTNYLIAVVSDNWFELGGLDLQGRVKQPLGLKPAELVERLALSLRQLPRNSYKLNVLPMEIVAQWP